MGGTERHRVVTVERGTNAEGRPGYAARCETAGCDAITFGGFPSRSAARRELDGHERRCTRCGMYPGALIHHATANGHPFTVAGNEEALESVAADLEGEDRNTITHEGEPIMTTVPPTADTSEEADWITRHPEVRDVAPHWATTIEVTHDIECVTVSYDRSFGYVDLSQCGVWVDGRVRMIGEVIAFFHANETVATAEDLHQYAADFRAAAEALGNPPRTLFRTREINEKLRELDQ